MGSTGGGDGGGMAAGIAGGLGALGTNMIASGDLSLNRSQAIKNQRWQERTALLNLALQDAAWKREDTAVQRRVQDLRAAGLSPVLAAGSAAQSSSPIRVEAPRRELVWSKFQNPDVAGLINSLLLTQAQVKKLDAEAIRTAQQTELDLLSFPERLNLISNKSRVALQEAMSKALQNAFYRETGVGPHSSELGRTAADLTKMIDSVIRGAMGNTRKPIVPPNK